MPVIFYNVKQTTNYDLINIPTEDITILVPERSDVPVDDKYPINFINEEVPYQVALENVNIIKLGYCCEPRGIIYPIFLQLNNNWEEINLGKECMYEFQPETWQNINSLDPEKKTSNVVCTGVKVPAGINFTLDYVIQ